MFVEQGPVLRGFFARRCANDDADDLVQEAWLRLLRAHHDQAGAIANPEAYIFTIALNLVRERAARRREAPLDIDALEAVGELPPGGECVEDQAARGQRRARLQALLHALPERTRAVLVMQYRDGLSYREIADRMGVSTHMVKKHVTRGLSVCRQGLGAEAEWR